MKRVALYGKRFKQKYFRLITVTLDKRAAAAQGRSLSESQTIDMWFTKEFDTGQHVPDRYDKVPLQHNPGAEWHGQAIKEGKKRQKLAKTAEERHWYAGQVAGHWGSYLESKGRGMPNPKRNTANGYIGPPIVDRTAPASETKKEESGTGTGVLVAIAVIASVAWLFSHHKKEV